MKSTILWVACILHLCSASVFAQAPKEIPVPPLGEDRYVSRTYFSVEGSLVLSVLPAPDHYYFAFTAPSRGPSNAQIVHMPIGSQGAGPGFSVMPGIDMPIANNFKFLGFAGVRYESASHSEVADQGTPQSHSSSYSLTLWSIALDAQVRRAINERFFVQAGFAVAYYVTDYFSGSYQSAVGTFTIDQQKSRYSYNPQRYAFTFGGGFLVPLVEQHIMAIGVNVRVPLSQLFYGVTSADYDQSGVAQNKLWGIDLTLGYNIPLGSAQAANDAKPAERN
jgi:hypothetical protein